MKLPRFIQLLVKAMSKDSVVTTKGFLSVSFHEVEKLFFQSYTKDTITVLYNQYFDAVLKQADLQTLSKYGIPFPFKKADRSAYIRVFSAIAYDPFLWESFWSSLSPQMKKLLEHATWNLEFSEKTMEEILGTTIRQKHERQGYYYSYDAKNTILPQYRFFAYRIDVEYHYRKSDYELDIVASLPANVRLLLKERLSPPKEAMLQILRTLPQTTFTYQNEAYVFEDLYNTVLLHEQGLLARGKTGKLLKTGLKQLEQTLGGPGFFPEDKELGLMHVELLSQLLKKMAWQTSSKSGRELVALAEESLWRLPLKDLFLSHLRNRSKVQEHGREAIQKSSQQLLGALEPGEWYSVENILRCIKAFEIPVYPVHPDDAADCLFVQDGPSNDYDDRVYIDTWELYQQAVVAPFIKGYFYLLGVLGCLELAYERPTKNDSNLENGKHEYLSVFDGLKYIRITNLGAYLLGKKTNYQIPKSQASKADILLDDQRLLITFHGKDKVRSMILSQMTDPLGSQRFRMTEESLFRHCDRIDDLKKKIDQFKRHIASAPPPVWEQFFEKLLQKANPFVSKNDWKVLKLTDSPELRQTVSQDPILKKYILKAEQHHILVKKANLQIVSRRMRQLGYFL